MTSLVAAFDLAIADCCRCPGGYYDCFSTRSAVRDLGYPLRQF